MPDQRYRWRNKQIRKQLAVINGEIAPTILLVNITYLNQGLRQWITANIWIYKDRIVYVGNELPANANNTEIIDCTNLYAVPGYIEPHAHPFQLYNPQTFAKYAAQTGTTTFINDNLLFAMLLSRKKAFTLIEELDNLPVSMFWWCRYDSQSEIEMEEKIFSHRNIQEWLQHDLVIQGGELSSWPRVLEGDDLVLHWIQRTKQLRKPVEGHLPGASEKTLTKMLLVGVDSEHESMSGEDVYARLSLGYTTSLRYSSIRPDLPKIIDEIHELGVNNYERLILNTDGSPPAFYENGVMDRLVRICLEKGVPEIDAYNMATYNAAKHYWLDRELGMIAPGRIAHINILGNRKNPTPISVLAKGNWVRKNGAAFPHVFPKTNWKKFGLAPLRLDWDLTMDDMQFSMPFGLEMTNSVIMKPYSLTIDVSLNELSLDHNESFLMLVDRNGKWRINTVIKGFASKVTGFISSYSNTGDFVIIGKNKEDMLKAFRRMKEIGGGIVLYDNGEFLYEVPLPLSGVMSDKDVQELIAEEKKLTQLLKERGYDYIDPVYTLLFLSSVHLPYIRITPQGIYDVMNKTILFPSIMR